MGLRQRHRAEPLGRAQRTQVCVAQRRRSVGFQQIGGAAREREEAKDVGREAAAQDHIRAALHGEGQAKLADLGEALLACGLDHVLCEWVRAHARVAIRARLCRHQLRRILVHHRVCVRPLRHESFASVENGAVGVITLDALELVQHKFEIAPVVQAVVCGAETTRDDAHVGRGSAGDMTGSEHTLSQVL